jgi:hypothetical protein
MSKNEKTCLRLRVAKSPRIKTILPRSLCFLKSKENMLKFDASVEDSSNINKINEEKGDRCLRMMTTPHKRIANMFHHLW